MPFLLPLIPAVIGAGVALNGQNQAKKAADASLAAQQQAQQQQLAAQSAALDRITQLQNPYVQTGYNALGQLASQYGLGTAPSGSVTNAYGAPAPQAGSGYGVEHAGGGAPGGATPGAPAQASGPDWNAYIQANPDVAARAQQGVASGEIGPNSQWKTPQDWAAFQYQNTGQSEGRAPPPMTTPTPQPTSAPTPPTAPQTPADLGTASPVVPTYTSPTFGEAPSASSYLDPSKFTTSPGYQFRLNEGLRNTNASFGAKGLLQSGAALKGFNDYAQNAASDEYARWVAQQQQLYQDDASRYNTNKTTDYNIFSTDRGYGTNLALNNRDFANSQQNTRIANLFSLVNAGTGAAASVGGANSNYAANAGNIYGSQAQSTADAANARASANSQFGGALGGIATGLINNYGSGSSGYTPLNLQTYSNPVGIAPGQIPYTGQVSYNPITY